MSLKYHLNVYDKEQDIAFSCVVETAARGFRIANKMYPGLFLLEEQDIADMRCLVYANEAGEIKATILGPF